MYTSGRNNKARAPVHLCTLTHARTDRPTRRPRMASRAVVRQVFFFISTGTGADGRTDGEGRNASRTDHEQTKKDTEKKKRE